MINEIRKSKKIIDKLIKQMDLEINSLPQGRVRCSSSNGNFQYFVDGQYISKKEIEYVENVCIRQYYSKLRPIIDSAYLKICELENIFGSNSELDRIYNNYCNGKKRLLNNSLYIPICERIDKFEREEYEKLEFDPNDNTEFYTIKGERVRSKSEKIIADELYRRNIPYKYEKPLVLLDKEKTVIFHPDFTIMNPNTGRIYILEHLGMLDNPKYLEKNMWKLNVYEKNGYLLGKNLLITKESGEMPLNVNVLNKYIEEYLL